MSVDFGTILRKFIISIVEKNSYAAEEYAAKLQSLVNNTPNLQSLCSALALYANSYKCLLSDNDNPQVEDLNINLASFINSILTSRAFNSSVDNAIAHGGLGDGAASTLNPAVDDNSGVVDAAYTPTPGLGTGAGTGAGTVTNSGVDLAIKQNALQTQALELAANLPEVDLSCTLAAVTVSKELVMFYNDNLEK